MKPLPRSKPNLQRLEAEVASRVRTLFERCPDLLGFSLYDLSTQDGVRAPAASEDDAPTVELGLTLTTRSHERDEAYELVTAEIDDLLSEEPIALALLRGRTFARTLH